MSIVKEYKATILYCDVCGEEIECNSFNDAVAYKTENGWKSKRTGNDWKDICPDCQ